MLVTADLDGQILVAPYNRLQKHHRCQKARGLAVVVTGQMCEIASISLKVARVQMSNAPAVTKPRGSRMGSLVGSMAPTLIRRDLRVASGSRGFEPLPIPGFLIFAFTAAGLTAALSMTFQHAPLLDAP